MKRVSKKTNTGWGIVSVRQRLVEKLWDLSEDEPVVPALIDRWSRDIVAKSNSDAGLLRSCLETISKSCLRMSRTLFHFLMQAFAKSDEHCDILIIPIMSRSNCRDMAEMLINSLKAQDPEIVIGRAGLSRHIFKSLCSVKQKRMVDYQLSLNTMIMPKFFRDADDIISQISVRLQDDQLLGDWFCNNKRRLRDGLAKFLQDVATVRIWFKQVGCKVVITFNEQDTSSSIFVTAARMNGIKCHQILHGTPARFYWPFVSEKTWVWGPISKEAFIEYGAPEESLPIIGNLEVTHWLKTASHKKRRKITPDDSSVQNLLFFSQLRGLDLYNATDFVDALDVIAKVFSGIACNWNLIVRMHPCDREKSLQIVRDKLGFLSERLIISQGSSSLLEDSVNADFACTCSSTAILAPLVMNIPCALLWGDDMERLVGKPFLPEKYIARNADELKILVETAQAIPRDQIESEMLANLETADKVAADYVLAELRN